MSSLDRDLLALPAANAIYDGEVVVLRPDGTTSFQDLQNAFGGEPAELSLYLFDLLYLDGHDLREASLEERKRALEGLCRALPADAAVRYSDHVVGAGADFHAEACRHALEGIVSKRRTEPYRGGRHRDWRKTKCQARQEFVVGGWTDPQGARLVLGALLVGVHEDGVLRYAGKVGSGYDRATLEDLRRRLKPLARQAPPFADPPAGARARGVHWVLPKLVVEVEFTGWTADGRLRHPTFQGVREDKRPEDVVREAPAVHVAGPRAKRAPRTQARSVSAMRRTSGDPRPAQPRKKVRRAGAPQATASVRASTATRGDAEVAGVRLSNPDRVLWPEAGITKLDLARHYERVAERILPHVAGRPVSIVRCPEGRTKECFFQRHAGLGVPDSVLTVEVDEQRGKKPYLMVDSLAGLIGLVQVGALELHPWGARGDKIERPDRIVFDLDPAEGVAWSSVTALAREIRARLADLGLESRPKLTGGKGLHVVVAIARRATWDEVKSFAGGIAKDLEREQPARVIATASKAARQGRIFVDWLRNARGASAIAPYSTRARDNAPVAAPIAWEELTARLRPDRFTLANLSARLAKPDPWEGFGENPPHLPLR